MRKEAPVLLFVDVLGSCAAGEAVPGQWIRLAPGEVYGESSSGLKIILSASGPKI